MKKFEESNYYELLEIPFHASAFEIKRAYGEAVSLYSNDSLFTYTLLSNDERVVILKNIEDAFLTLIDDKKRASYDTMLRGQSSRIEEQEVKKLPSPDTDSNCEIVHREIITQRIIECAQQVKHTSDFSSEDTLTSKILRRNSDPARIARDKRFDRHVQQLDKKHIRRLLYLPLAVTSLLIMISVMLYSLSTSSKFLKDMYSRDFSERSRIEEDKRNGPERQLMISEPKPRSEKESGSVVKEQATKLQPASPGKDSAEVYVSVASVANIRSRPTITSQVLLKVRRGKKLVVVGKDGDWLQVKLPDGSMGWIYRALVKKSAASTLTSLVQS
ncbi:MAG: SH3 domain-containing protein [Deltaproteobacteria bacterium]|nr:MAG: SH3 domain-containing protein [Deltaproteobacteria bacterium]